LRYALLRQPFFNILIRLKPFGDRVTKFCAVSEGLKQLFIEEYTEQIIDVSGNKV